METGPLSTVELLPVVTLAPEACGGRLFALKERLDLPDSPSRKDLDRAMQGKILARCELLGIYSRK
jgi:hypothetical protein